MGTPALRVSGAGRRYHDRQVFTALDLAVDEGELFVLLGPSGCGKSTLLRALAGLEPLDTGALEIAHSGPGSPKVGIVFQEPRLLPWLTVAENVALGGRYRANRTADVQGAVAGVLADFGLIDLADAYPDSLSGGQAQRVSFARTIVTRPDVLLLDEPFAALDPQTRAALQDWLVDLVHRRRLTTILVTHDLDEALRTGDRVGLMSAPPGAIDDIWEPRRSAGRDDPEMQAMRAAMLARYQSAVPTLAGADRYVI